jgi:predicted phage tail protein
VNREFERDDERERDDKQMVGSQTVTKSELEIEGLARGNQYWIRVRAVRAGKIGPWSDEATRVANI